MYSGLYAAVGAMCNTDEEAQQAQFPVIMLLVVPIIMFVTNVIENPDSAARRGPVPVPALQPILMWARVAGGGVPAWQIALSFVAHGGRDPRDRLGRGADLQGRDPDGREAADAARAVEVGAGGVEPPPSTKREAAGPGNRAGRFP